MKYYNMYPRGVSLIMMLLCCLGLNAQTYLQYWFDTDTKLKKADLSAGVAKEAVDVQHLSQGLHTLYMRARTPGAEFEYSPITTSTFIKFTTGDGSVLEYWFDEDVDNRSTIDVNAESGKEQVLNLDLSNLDRFPTGVHQLNMRVAHNGGHYSPVYSAYVLRLLGGSDGTRLEYWFDEDYDNPSSIDVNAESGEEQMLMLDLSNIERFPFGVHQLNMRVAHVGGHYSPVYSAYVLRLPGGTGDSVMEYWFDDDFENHASIPVSTDKDGVQALNLDLSDMSKFPYGFHRLNMRVASLGSQYSPVYSANVMRLRAGANNYLSYWLDDDYANRHHVMATAGHGKEPSFKTKLDFSQVSAGMHRLHYRIASQNIDDGPVYEVPVLVTRWYNDQTDVKVTSQSWWMDDNDANTSVFANPKNIVTQKYTLDPTKFDPGQYAFHVQYQNSAMVWSAENVTYFYKEAASGRLRAGIMPEDPTGIEDTSQAENVSCTYYNGTIYIDCESPQLGKTGVVIVCDMMGRIVAQQSVTNSDGIHAAISVENLANQLLIVRLNSGNVRYSQKIFKR